MSEEELLKNNIKSVSIISEKSFEFDRIIIIDIENIEYKYDIKTSEFNSIDRIVKKHINKKLRKEKLLKINEVYWNLYNN
jgi:hypothetical protein